MVSITIHNLPYDTHRALHLRAAQKGRSLEAEVLSILAEATKPEGGPKLSSLPAPESLTEKPITPIHPPHPEVPRSGLEGALQEAPRSLEPSFEASAALRHLRMRSRAGEALTSRLGFGSHNAGGLTDSEAASFCNLRDRTPTEPVRFE